MARTKIAEEVCEGRERQAITTKHDKARLLHLRVDPRAMADWTAAMREKTRTQLDADMADADPWNRLAEKFNNYEQYKYHNATVKMGVQSSAGLYVAEIGLESIALECHELNPSSPGRPLRDASWVRTQFRDLKTKISVCYNNYRRSGNQDAENRGDAWIKYSKTFNNDVVTYAISLLDDGLLDQMGRALPLEVQRDTGALDQEDSYDNRVAKAQARKRQRKDTPPSGENATAALTSPMSTADDWPALMTGGTITSSKSALATTIALGMATANQIAKDKITEETRLVTLKYVMEYGSAEDKAKAYEEIRTLSGIK